MSRLTVALIQLAADSDVAANLDRAAELVHKAGDSKPGLIALPEMFQYRGPLAEVGHGPPEVMVVRQPGGARMGETPLVLPAARTLPLAS